MIINAESFISACSFATLNLSYRCNLSCPWCFIGDFQNVSMSKQTLSLITSLLNGLGIHRVFLSGGEPTIQPDFFSTVRHCRTAGLRVSVNTHGLAFADSAFLAEAIASGVSLINLSLKAVDARDFLANTGRDGFDRQRVAVKNISADKRCTLIGDITINRYFMKNFQKALDLANLWGLDYLVISFAKSSQSKNDGNPEILDTNEILDFIRDNYHLLKASGLSYSFRFDLPVCLLESRGMSHLSGKLNFLTNCFLRDGSKIVFDPQGGLIPCDILHNNVLGRIGEDFSTVREYREFLRRPDVVEKRAWLTVDYSPECKTCPKAIKCCRGCAASRINLGE